MASKETEKLHQSTFSEKLFNNSFKILGATRSPFWFAYLMLFLRALVIICSTINTSPPLLETPLNSPLKYVRYLTPYSLNVSYTDAYCRILISVILINNLGLAFGLLRLHNNNKKSPILAAFGYFVYCFMYFGAHYFVGLSFAYFAQEKVNTGTWLVVYSAGFGLCIGFTLVLFLYTWLIFFNFYLKRKDALSRSMDYWKLLLNTLFMAIVVSDVFVTSGVLNSQVKDYLSFGVAVLSIWHFGTRIPFRYYDVSLAYLLSLCFFVVTAFMKVIANVFQVAYIAGNFPIVLVAAWLMTAFDLWLFHDRIFYYIINSNEVFSANSPIFIKKLILLLELFQNSKTDKRSELKLVSFLHSHQKKCKEPSCVCHKRENIWDNKNERSNDKNQPPWRDYSFLPQLVNSIFKQQAKDCKLNSSAMLFAILLNIEMLGNNVITVFYCQKFTRMFKGVFEFNQRLIIKQVEKKVSSVIEKKAKSMPFSRNPYEKLLQFDLLMNKLKESIIELVKLYKQFWMTVKETAVDLQMLQKESEAVFARRKANKKLFFEAKQLFSLSKELDYVEFLYKNFVIWEPIDLRDLKKKQQQLDSKITLERQGTHFLDPFDKDCCVVGVLMDQEESNKISMASNNTARIFETDLQGLNFFQLDKLMPSIIGRVHSSFLESFKQSQVMTHMYRMAYLWCLTAKKKLFLTKSSIKILLHNSGLSLFGHIRAICYKQYLIVNKDGEIDCFGEFFHGLTGIDYDFQAEDLVLSIFMFMPTIIPIFLSHFYDNPAFFLNKFRKQWLRTSFFFVFKKQRVLISELSKLLQHSRQSKFEYCQALYSFLSKLSFANIAKVYKVSMHHQEFSFQKGQHKAQLIEVAIHNIFDITSEFTNFHFQSAFCFIDKLHLSEDLLYSLSKWPARAIAKKYVNKHPEIIKTRLIVMNSNEDTLKAELLSGIQEQTILQSKRASEDDQKAIVKNFSYSTDKSFMIENEGEYTIDSDQKRSGKVSTTSEQKLGTDYSEAKKASEKRQLYDKFYAHVTAKKSSWIVKYWRDLFRGFIVKRGSHKHPEVLENVGKLIRSSACELQFQHVSRECFYMQRGARNG